MSLKIVADAHIPFVEEIFSAYGELDLIPGHKIDPISVRDADALIVRSITTIDKELLSESSIRFVGSATAGTDHVDLAYLHASGIKFANAPGGNADSVVEYVLAGIFALAISKHIPILGTTLGIIGCGQVGGRLARRAEALGFNVIENDPPLARESIQVGRSHLFKPLEYLLASSDVITLHVPLTRDGLDPTEKLISEKEFDLMPRNVWLFNAARGGVIDESELLRRCRQDLLKGLVLDVWENEPLPTLELQQFVDIGTPHIAGYSRDAKFNTAGMVADAFRTFFQISDDAQASVPPPISASDLVPPKADPNLQPAEYIHELLVQMYPITADHQRMIDIPDVPASDRAAAFRALRADYPARYTFSRYHLRDARLSADLKQKLASGLGIQLPSSG